MRITSFNPAIITENVDDVVKLFEELGFKKRHQSHVLNSEGKEASGIRMRDENGFYVNITQRDSFGRDLTFIRMNVDDFDEACEMLAARGFKNAASVVVTKTNKNAAFVSPSGFMIHVCHHIKDHD
jgi:adenylate cyclase class IV